MSSTLPLSEVKSRLSEVADEVARTHERVHVTKNGREFVVLIAADDLESLEATVELLDDPEAQQRLAVADADVAAGGGVSEQELADAMRRRSTR
jgi:prevent-host-death family protein